MHKKKILILSGTRPEAIKLAPVYLALKERGADVRYVKTGQHSELHDQVVNFFGIEQSGEFFLPNKHRDLPTLCASLINVINTNISAAGYTHAIVQGDTATAFCGANVAFLNKIPLFHVEAGLRSGSVQEPFPEEALRRMISVIADIHFCPTSGARENLIREGVSPEKIHTTGNTVIDAIRHARNKKIDDIKIITEIGEELFRELNKKSFILLTVHRRENHGHRLERICEAIKQYCEDSDMRVLCPLHPNPNVQTRVQKLLSGQNNIHLTAPLSYPVIIWALEKCQFIVSDSGGLQEEAPSFNKQIIILRDQTERQEVIQSGWGSLQGTERENILKSLRIMENRVGNNRLTHTNPFGDGYASEHISDVVLSH